MSSLEIKKYPKPEKVRHETCDAIARGLSLVAKRAEA
jgi:hypothetical protein